MALVLDRVRIKRGGRVLVRDLSCRLAPGQSVHLTGPNGCGKSSTLRAVAGLLPVESGTIHWQADEEPAGPYDTDLVEQRLYIATRPPLEPRLTVRDHLSFWAGLLHSQADQVDLLQQIGLLLMADRPVQHLSTGQAQRLSLSRLKLHQGRLWLLDEPTLGLDAAGKSLLGDWLDQHIATGGMILAASHEPLPGTAPVTDLSLGQPQVTT
ncbi:MAG: heme ABC exporter ATP-binding protein CcmA [Alphaproteobacteria bacterium]